MNLYEHKIFDWNACTRFFWWLTGVISALILVTVICSIWSGAGYNDEAWLVLMVKNQANGFWTSFAHYYKFMQNWGLSSMRTAVAILHGIACGIFVWGCLDYYKPFPRRTLLHGVGLWAVVALIPQVFWLGGVVLAPDYKFVAYDCVLVGTGFLFLGMRRTWLLVLSGGFYAQLLFTMPQIGILYPVIFVVVGLKSFRILGWFILGVILGIATFFIFISSWSSFLECFHYSGTRLVATHSGSRHGVGMLINGYAKIVLTFLSEIMPAALALCAARRLPGRRGKIMLSMVMLSILGYFLLGTLKVLSWKSAGCPACSLDVFLIIACAVLLEYCWKLPAMHRQNLQDAALALLFIIIPVFFCTGTDKGFENRLTFYIGVLLTGIIVFIYQQRNRLLLWSLNGYLILSLLGGIIYWKQSSNWQLLPRTINAREVGLPADARITQEMANHLKTIQNHIGEAKIIINDPCHWYVPWLLDKEPFYLSSFRYYQFDDVSEMIRRSKLAANEIVLLESSEYALTDTNLETIKVVLDTTRIERFPVTENSQLLRFE